MSNRPWTCMSCGWTGSTNDAAYTDAGAKRCPTCRSGALVLADPEKERRNAEGTAKRINGERRRKLEREAPLLLHAGIERVQETDADEVMRRRDDAERSSAIWWREHMAKEDREHAQAMELRAALVEQLDPGAIAALDQKCAALPRSYALSFWKEVTGRHADGRLAEEAAAEVAGGERAIALHADVAAMVDAAELARLEELAVQMRALAGTRAERFWQVRLADALGVPVIEMRRRFEAARAERFGRPLPPSVSRDT